MTELIYILVAGLLVLAFVRYVLLVRKRGIEYRQQQQQTIMKDNEEYVDGEHDSLVCFMLRDGSTIASRGGVTVHARKLDKRPPGK